MQIRAFALERYFAEHEFTARHLLSASDCESLSLPELLALCDDETRGLWQDLWLGYTESSGHPLLREEIAQHYDRQTAQNILVAAPEEAIFVAMHALLAPGDEMIVTWPAYQSLAEIARSIGCRVTQWPLELIDGAWRLDVDGLADLITPQTRLLIVNFPHNPTGYLPTLEAWRRIIGIAQHNGLYLFSDEMYRLLEQDEADRLLAGCDAYERSITLSGLSKSYGLPGLRIGWLATQDATVLAGCQAIKDYTTICASAPSEILALGALRAGGAILSRNRSLVEENLRLADAFFAQHPEQFAWLRPAGGPVAFPQLTTGETSLAWCQRLLAERQVMIAPGELFDHPGNHFRIGLGRKGLGVALQEIA